MSMYVIHALPVTNILLIVIFDSHQHATSVPFLMIKLVAQLFFKVKEL